MTEVLKTLAVLTLALTVAVPAAAQSLGDVAKKEEARRKTASKPGKLYTNDSLKGGGEGTAAPPASAPADAQPAPSDAQPKPEESPKPDASTERKKDETAWRKRIADARSNLERAKTFHEALQSRINALSTDYVNRDDPYQRNVIATNRQKALDELERVSKEVAAAEKQIADIEEEARTAGIPPGWLR